MSVSSNHIERSTPYMVLHVIQRNFMLNKRFPDLWNGLILNPYLQPSSFGRRVNNYERPRFYPDGRTDLPDGMPGISVLSVNNEKTRSALRQVAPDLIYIFSSLVFYEKATLLSRSERLSVPRRYPSSRLLVSRDCLTQVATAGPVK